MKVLIIEHEKTIIDAITLSFLVEWPHIEIIPTENGGSGIEIAERESPDLIILDIGLPDISGLEVLRKIREVSDIPVIILTAILDESGIMQCLDRGASDFIMKPFSKMELVARTKSLLKKHSFPQRRMAISIGHIRYDPDGERFSVGSNVLNLTETESEILYTLMKNAGSVVRYSALSGSVWNNDDVHSVNSLKVHVHNLREKLKNASSSSTHMPLIHTYSGLGYSLESQD